MTTGDIWVIGTEPPCPRCDYLTRMVKDIVNASGLSIAVKHLAYTSEDARRFAAALGLVPGTAKDVARKASVDVNWEKIHTMIDSSDQDATCCPTAAGKWSPALDEALRPCERVAQKVGVLMTPALVMGGELRHQGSVPDRKKVSMWIQTYWGTGTSISQNEHIVEVLGPGCPKCAMLYDNVIQALAQTEIHERVTVRKRSDLAYFQEMGVFVTPGLVIDGRVASKGKVMTVDQLADLLQNHMSV